MNLVIESSNYFHKRIKLFIIHYTHTLKPYQEKLHSCQFSRLINVNRDKS
jgi:hypothetical protein